MTDVPTLPPTGYELIQSYLKTIDGSPGVYRMLNAASEVLYVGKARNLRARVSNYARPSGHSARIARMIFETASMMFLTTRTETEALLLEQPLQGAELLHMGQVKRGPHGALDDLDRAGLGLGGLGRHAF
jgi:excinuclease ABC subunit C